MPVTYVEVEERVIKICCDLETQEILNISFIARKYKALKDRVYRGFTEKLNRRIKTEDAGKVSDDTAEQALCLYVEFADDFSISIREFSLIKAANFIR